MNDCLINIRLGTWHFQLTRDFKPRISRNKYHEGWPDGVFAVYDFFGWSKY